MTACKIHRATASQGDHQPIFTPERATPGSPLLDEATQTRHAKRPDHYLCDAVEELFTHLSSLGVKWSQVQILSARPLEWRLSCEDGTVARSSYVRTMRKLSPIVTARVKLAFEHS